MADHMMTAEEAASRLHGSEYGNEGSCALFAEMKKSRLVAIYGASDDLCEIRGIVEDELGAWQGRDMLFTQDGLLMSECASGTDCPYYQRSAQRATLISAVWDRDGYSWVYHTTIPNVTFDVMEDGGKYCRGIVFSLAKLHFPYPATSGSVGDRE
jgi:hypothetical protein